VGRASCCPLPRLENIASNRTCRQRFRASRRGASIACFNLAIARSRGKRPVLARLWFMQSRAISGSFVLWGISGELETFPELSASLFLVGSRDGAASERADTHIVANTG
jgi:hypothetical protein